MAKAVFTSTLSESISVDFRTECWFRPKYVSRAQAAMHDRVIIHRTRESSGYAGIARLVDIEITRPEELVLARLTDYVSFDFPIPLLKDGLVYESGFRSELGYLKGWAMAESVRLISDIDFFGIIEASQFPHGFNLVQPRTPDVHAREQTTALRLLEHIEAQRAREIHERAKRERAFSLAVLQAYDNQCGVDGRPQSSGDGKSVDLQACHLWAVKDGGPDVIENAIALSAHWHWRLDHHLFTLEDDGRIILSSRLDERDRAVLKDRTITFPRGPGLRPSAQYLDLHRKAFFERQG